MPVRGRRRPAENNHVMIRHLYHITHYDGVGNVILGAGYVCHILAVNYRFQEKNTKTQQGDHVAAMNVFMIAGLLESKPAMSSMPGSFGSAIVKPLLAKAHTISLALWMPE